MKTLVLFFLSYPLFANYSGGIFVALATGKTTYTLTNSGPQGGVEQRTAGLAAFGGSFQRIGVTISMDHISLQNTTSYTSCADPCGVGGTAAMMTINRQKGIVYARYEKLDSSGNQLFPRQYLDAGSAYDNNTCAPLDTFPHISYSTVTTSPMPMPLVMVWHDCYVGQLQFPLVSGHAFASQRLYVRISNPGYSNPNRPDGKFSFQINGGAWVPLTNAVCTGVDASADYGGIGSFDQTREFTCSISDGSILVGDTTITIGIRFNGTDGITSGGRILAINIIEANVACSSITTTTGSPASSVITCAGHGFTNGNDFVVLHAPDIWMMYHGLRHSTAATSSTLTFRPCNTGNPWDTACVPANETVAPPVSTDPSGNAITATRVMYVARAAIAASSFVQIDPTTWTAPGGGDATRGGKIFRTGNASGTTGQFDQLMSPNTPFLNDKFHVATCGGPNGCHTSGNSTGVPSGSDLKRFNYDNGSIGVRTEFHGFSEQDGLDIEAYIRGLSVTVPVNGRPWNPPMQPCPGLSSGSTEDFWAGGARDCVLEYGYADWIKYAAPGGDKSKWVWTEKFETRDVPTIYPFQDWNKMLPTLHPADAYPNGDFLSSTPFTTHRDIMDNMTENNFSSFQSYNYGQTCGPYVTWMNSQYVFNGTTAGANGTDTAAGNWFPGNLAQIRYSAMQYYFIRQYDISVDKQTFQFEGQRNNAVNGASNNVNWPHATGFSGFGLFTCMAPHKITTAEPANLRKTWPNDGLIKSFDATSNWAYVGNTVLYCGDGWDSANSPCDNAYLNTYTVRMGQYRPGGYLTTFLGSMVVPQQGSASKYFFQYQFNGAFTTSDGTHLVWSSGDHFDPSMTGQVGLWNGVAGTATYVDSTHLTTSASTTTGTYAINSGGAGTDYTSVWSKTLTYDFRYTYPWFSSAAWLQNTIDYLGNINAITSAHTVDYWNRVFTNSGDVSPNASAAWGLSSGGTAPTTAMLLTLFKVWCNGDSTCNTALTTYLDWAKSITQAGWAAHNFDNDIAAASNGAGTTNGAATTTGDLTAGSNRTITFDTMGGHTGCPAAASATTGVQFTFWGGTGSPESTRPVGGTCASAGSAGTLVFNLRYNHTGAWKISYGLDIGIPPNYDFNGLGTEPNWWAGSNML